MGGYGSGQRCGVKRTTGSQLMLDIRWMKKQNHLRPGTLGTLVWTCRGEDSGSVSFRTESDQLVLNYRTRLSGDECESVEDRIPFTWTKCNYGGQRQWFLCPGVPQTCWTCLWREIFSLPSL